MTVKINRLGNGYRMGENIPGADVFTQRLDFMGMYDDGTHMTYPGGFFESMPDCSFHVLLDLSQDMTGFKTGFYK
jgi:hypothetical protein